VAVFHLMTHAFFKALLFLGAGSVIIGMHHDQDIRNMGGLRKYMPVTWITSLIGSLALIGTPFLSGFYSKDSIIEAVHYAKVPGAGFASFAVMAGVFVTAFYSFRMYFLVFHGKERFGHASHGDGHDDHADEHHGLAPGQKPHESPAVVVVPLVLLAIPSAVIGLLLIKPMLFGDFFKGVIAVGEGHPAMEELAKEFHGWAAMGVHALTTLPFWLAVAGVVSAWYCYLVNPAVPARIKSMFGGIYRLLDNKYYLDIINERVFAGGSRLLGRGLWKAGDQGLIDGLLVNGSARLVGWIAGVIRWVQSGFIYHYAIAMIVGVAVLLWWFVNPLMAR
jgi:NADH-quinone oxidoreductase subunit L